MRIEERLGDTRKLSVTELAGIAFDDFGKNDHSPLAHVVLYAIYLYGTNGTIEAGNLVFCAETICRSYYHDNRYARRLIRLALPDLSGQPVYTEAESDMLCLLPK